MAKNDYEFTHCLRYDEKKIKVNLCFLTQEYAVIAARYIVDLMVHESKGTKEELDPSKFKLHYRPMKSGVSNVRTKPTPQVPPAQPAPTAPPVEAPPVEAPPAKAKRSPRKAKA